MFLIYLKNALPKYKKFLPFFVEITKTVYVFCVSKQKLFEMLVCLGKQ